MNPTPQAIAALRAAFAPTLSGAGTDGAVAAAINATTVANPVPVAPTVPKPFVTADLMGTLDAAALTNIRNLPSLARLLDDIAAQLPGPLDNWINLMGATGTVTPAQAAALSGIVHATEPDPSWAAQVPWPLPNLGRLVDAADISAARSS